MGGYWSDECSDECADDSGKIDYLVKRNPKNYFPKKPVIVDKLKSAKRMFITPEKQNANDLDNYGILPKLVIMNISLYMEIDDLVNMFCSCKLFYHVSNSNLFWRNYYQAYYSNSNKNFVQDTESRNETSGFKQTLNWKKQYYTRHIRYSDRYYIKKYSKFVRENHSALDSKMYKFVLLGRERIGKTTFIHRVNRDEFVENLVSTIGVDFLSKSFVFSERAHKLYMWDTAGQERFRSLSMAYFRGASIALVCFAINDKDSFEKADRWLQDLKRANYKNGEVDMTTYPVVLLCGLKKDLGKEREVFLEDVEKMIEREENKYIHGYVENSSLTGDGIMLTVGLALDLVRKREEEYEKETTNRVLRIDDRIHLRSVKESVNVKL